jgi:sulfide dehydrogenase cytochrome subunit
MSGPGRRLRAAVIAAAAVAGGAAWDAAGDLAAAPPGASSCSGCHAARAGSSIPAITGRPADEIVAALDAFRTGKRPATVMNRIAPGFSDGESRAIAAWLSTQPAPR